MAGQSVQLTGGQFIRLRDLIYAKLGLFFEDNRLSFVQKRIEKRMALREIGEAEEYVRCLHFHDAQGEEMQQLANLLTTNETYMFREFGQLRAFTDFALPEVLNTKQKEGDQSLRIWSAGCSSGEEAYTLAIIMKEVLQDASLWRIEIIATDIDQNMLQRVDKAVYNERSVKEVPQEYFSRHLTPDPKGFRVRAETAQLVTVKHLNLHDHMALRTMRGLDFIFCRNVLIYFSDQSRKAVVDYFYTALKPGGYIFLGHSESVGRISNAYKLVRLGDHLAYKK